jgi:hypothetical protein
MHTIQADWAKDKEDARKFWIENDANMRLSMIKILEDAKKTDPPLIYVQIDQEGLTEKNIQKLAAYRLLAEEMGWEIGSFDVNSISHTVSAPMRQLPPQK